MKSMFKVVVVFFAIMLFVGCASKKGAYQVNEAPKEIIKEVEVIKIDTVVIIKTVTIIKTELIEKHDTIYIEKEAEEKNRKLLESMMLDENEKKQLEQWTNKKCSEVLFLIQIKMIGIIKNVYLIQK